MFIINKKRLIFIIFSCLIPIFITTFNYNYIETSSVPINNHIILLDAGHGFPDGGAVAKDGTSEEAINLQIVFKIQKLLEASGCNVILTRSDEKGIYNLNSKNKKRSDMKNRVSLANSSNSDLFISIHLNKIDITECSGYQTFYKKGNNNGKILANCIQNNLNNAIQKNNKREPLPLSNKYILDNINTPTVIVECGFLSNPNELELLKEETYQDTLAWGIYTGIIDYFSENML